MQVGKMLEDSIIQPNHSPFSLPPLLVEKKDDSWRSYVDHKKLNSLMVKIKFLILLLIIC